MGKGARKDSAKPQGKAPFLKRSVWYRLQRFFAEPAQKVAEVQGQDVICEGRIYEGVLTCECGRQHMLERLMVTGDPRVELSGQGEGATITLQPNLAVCVVPPEALSSVMGKQLEVMTGANLRCPVVVMTNNIQLAQFKEISEATAKQIVAKQTGQDTQAEAEAEAEPKGGEGANVVSIKERQTGKE